MVVVVVEVEAVVAMAEREELLGEELGCWKVCPFVDSVAHL